MPNEFLNLSRDEELVTYRRRRARDAKPPFTIIGNGLSNRNGRSMDTLEILTSLSPGPAKLFVAMVRARDVDTNQVARRDLIKGTELNGRHVDNHLPKLLEVDLVRRLEPGLWMINPMVIMPPNGTDARQNWSLLAQEESEQQPPP
jgi:hypothetical protein